MRLRDRASLLFAIVAIFCLWGCDTGGEGDSSGGDDATNNNTNGYCWSEPADCWDLRPLEDDKHYHCCFDKTGYYCDKDEVLHTVECDHACTYDADEDLIYCASGPNQGQGGETQPIPPGSHF